MELSQLRFSLLYLASFDGIKALDAAAADDIDDDFLVEVACLFIGEVHLSKMQLVHE